jgi:integrase/recombinase XerD
MEVERGTHAVPTLSRSELDTLLAEVPAAPDGLRFAALCELLFVSGLRISEALSLQMSDLEVIGDILMVRVPSVEGCKTGFRPVPVPIDDTPLAHALDAWLAVRYAGPWVFSTYNGTPMHRNSFSRALNGYAGKSGLSKRVHPHLFRHSAATNWLAAGMPELYVQQMLGHKSLEMTSQYSAQNVAGIVEWMRR